LRTVHRACVSDRNLKDVLSGILLRKKDRLAS
jgi:hypothetical protein